MSVASDLSTTLSSGLNISTAFRKSAEVAPHVFLDLAIRAATLLTATRWQKVQGSPLKSLISKQQQPEATFFSSRRTVEETHSAEINHTVHKSTSNNEDTLLLKHFCFDMH